MEKERSKMSRGDKTREKSLGRNSVVRKVGDTRWKYHLKVC